MFWVRCSSTAALSASDQGRFRTPRFPVRAQEDVTLEIKQLLSAA